MSYDVYWDLQGSMTRTDIRDVASSIAENLLYHRLHQVSIATEGNDVEMDPRKGEYEPRKSLAFTFSPKPSGAEGTTKTSQSMHM